MNDYIYLRLAVMLLFFALHIKRMCKKRKYPEGFYVGDGVYGIDSLGDVNYTPFQYLDENGKPPLKGVGIVAYVFETEIVGSIGCMTVSIWRRGQGFSCWNEKVELGDEIIITSVSE